MLQVCKLLFRPLFTDLCVDLSVWHPYTFLSMEQDRLRSYPHEVCTLMRSKPGGLWWGPTSLSLLVAQQRADLAGPGQSGRSHPRLLRQILVLLHAETLEVLPESTHPSMYFLLLREVALNSRVMSRSFVPGTVARLPHFLWGAPLC